MKTYPKPLSADNERNMAEKHPFDVTREKAEGLIALVDEAFDILHEVRKKGFQHGPFSSAPIAQLNNRSFEEWLTRLKADLEMVHGARTRSKKHKDLFQALFRFPVDHIDNNFQSIIAKLRELSTWVNQNHPQAAQKANNFYGQMQHQINQINAGMVQIEAGLPHVLKLQAKPDPYLEAVERLQAIETSAEGLVKQLETLEQEAQEKVELIDKQLPRAEELGEEIQKLTALLAQNLATDEEVKNMPLHEAIKLLGQRLTTLRQLLEERSENAEQLEKELGELLQQAEGLEAKAKKLLEESERVLGQAEGTALAKWFKQAHDEYQRKLDTLRSSFLNSALGVGIGMILYVILLPFLLAGAEELIMWMGWDGNLVADLFSRLMLATPISVGLFYFWRIYNEYATTERLAHRYRHWQALGASLGGFRMLTGEGDLSDELTAATFLSVIDDPLGGRPQSSEELGFLQRLFGFRYKRKRDDGEEEIEAGVIPKDK